MARLVKCPKCTKLLIEYAEVPIYECGGCAAVLRAKNYNAGGEDLISKSPRSNRQESPSKNGFSDSRSRSAKENVPSSSLSQSSKLNHNGEQSSLPDINLSKHHEGGEFSEFDVSRSYVSSIPQEVSQVNNECSLNQNVEEHPKVSDQVYDSLKLINEAEEISNSVVPSIASEEDVVEKTQDNGGDDILKSLNLNDGHQDHTRDRHVHKSRRTFRHHAHDKIKCKEKEVSLGHNKAELEARSLSSKSSDETNNSDVVRIFSALKDEISSKYEASELEGVPTHPTELRSINSLMELEMGGSSSRRSPNEGLAVKSDWHDRTELLRKIDELKDQLTELVRRKDTEVSHNRDFHDIQHAEYQSKINMYHHSRRSSYGQLSNVTEQFHFRQMSFSGKHPCSCIHCQEQKQKQLLFHGNRLFRANTRDACSNSSKAKTLHDHDIDLEKAPVKEKPKRHCRPISQGAPFVVCGNCMTLLQLPTDFLMSRRKYHKLQCGACTEVLMLPFPARNYTLPTTASEVVHSTMEVSNTIGNEDEFSSAEHRHSTESYSNVNCVLDISRNSSEGIGGKSKGPAQLHHLLGYASASELLYEHDGIDKVHGSSESPLLRSRRPSNGSLVSNESPRSGINSPRREPIGSNSSPDSVDMQKEDDSKKGWRRLKKSWGSTS